MSIVFELKYFGDCKRWQYVICRRFTWRTVDWLSELVVTYFKNDDSKKYYWFTFPTVFCLLSVDRNGWLVFNILSFWLDYRGKRRRNLTGENWRRGFHCNEERYLLDAVAEALWWMLRTVLADCLLADCLCVLLGWFARRTLWLVEKFKPRTVTIHGSQAVLFWPIRNNLHLASASFHALGSGCKQRSC